MTEYCPRAVPALQYLFRPFNDLDVYIEDKNCCNAYTILINRILGDKARIYRVFPLGNWQTVIAKCRSLEGATERSSLFIIDGDFRVMTEESVDDLDDLYQLGVYCCENLLYCFDAATEVAFDSVAERTREEIRDTLELEKLQELCADTLFELFVGYAVADSLGSEEKTSGQSVYEFCELVDGEHQLSPAKVEARAAELHSGLKSEFGADAVTERENLIRQNLAGSNLDYRHVVSGKTYLLPLLLRRLKRRASYKGEMIDFRNRLARYCSLDIEPGLTARVLLAVQEI